MSQDGKAPYYLCVADQRSSLRASCEAPIRSSSVYIKGNTIYAQSCPLGLSHSLKSERD